MTNNLNFKDIDERIKETYYNSDDNTILEFLVPILKRSKIYKRETYSFSSAILSLINNALIDIIKNDCKIYYIVGIELEEKDVDAIENGLEDNENLIEREIEIEFGKVENLLISLGDKHNRRIYEHRLKVLSYLISKKILTIKVGFVTKQGRIKNPDKFKFHPKVMIFYDFEGNSIVANGSTNEGFGAHVNNEEAFDVFKSWNPATLSYYNRHINKFEEFWENQSSNIKTLPINELIEKKLLKKYKGGFRDKEEIIRIEEELNNILKIQESQNSNLKELNMYSLRPYQEKVIKNWLDHDCKGIFSLATGAGKTIMAIESIKRLTKIHNRLITIIVCPYKALCEQWVDELQFNIINIPVLAYESSGSWYSLLNHKLLSFKMKHLDSIVIVTTNDTFSGDSFQKSLDNYWGNVFLVIDECHHVANASYTPLLSSQVPYRLGLSATPENEEDVNGNRVLYSFFKEITPEPYGLSEAIRDEYLNKYNYYPILTDLDENEKENFEKLLEKILAAKKENDQATLLKLYDERDVLMDTAKTKLPNLNKLLNKIDDLSFTILYCSDNEQLQKVAHILKDKGIKFGRITANESNKDRKNIINNFKEGYLKILLSIRVLDEGINIPAIRRAIILKSSLRTRQSIQRRGRCLRLLKDADGKPLKKHVEIYDFIVIPKYTFKPKQINDLNDEMIAKELTRIHEFITLAINKDDAEKVITRGKNIYI